MMALPVKVRLAFFGGTFLIAMCGLVLQILQTRILSVITWYHLAFFAISMAMFGMTAGSLFVYFRHHLFPPQQLFERLAQICMAFSLSAVASILLMLSTVVIETSATMMTVLLWLKLILIIVPPYVFAGMAISLALTRSPFPIGLVYAVDLAGAAMGCLAILVLLNLVDGVSAMIAVGALGALAAACFAAAHQLQEQPSRSPSQPKRPSVLRRSLAVAAILTSLAAGNAWLQPRDGLALTIAKGEIERPDRVAAMRWNSFSRIKTTPSAAGAPAMWGASVAMPPTTLNQRMLNIDGAAGTFMYQFGGDIRVLDFLKYDVTNLAYYIRNHGRAAVIGVGGGRDVLSAYVFGFRDVTGVELNPIFVDFLEKDFHDYNRLTDLPGVHLNVDEARSWFARTTDRFDLVQMSMIDTWAATGAGAFSLSENGLYTIQGWARFLDRLTPSGVFTVSRWYAPNNVNETGRLVSLAKAALLELGIRDPAKQMFLVGHEQLSTLIVGRAPFTTEDIASLKQASARLGYHVLVSPDASVAAPLLHEIMAAPDLAALNALAGSYHLDVSPPTDERPFFFNQLRMSDPVSMLQALHAGTSVVRGNLTATLTLALIVGLSALLVLLTILIPSLPAVRQVAPSVAGFGTLYFLLIGLGFMFVEIGLIQRLSIFLGHPVYGLAIGLFGIILSTGLGSFLSEHLPLDRPRRLIVWAVALAICLGALPLWFPSLTASFEGADLGPRIMVCLAAVVPSGVLMGFGFPSGMRLANAIDSRSTPWFWAINGAAGVLAAGIAVAVSIEFSISTSIWLGAACYLLLAAVAPLFYWAGAKSMQNRRGDQAASGRAWSSFAGQKPG